MLDQFVLRTISLIARVADRQYGPVRSERGVVYVSIRLAGMDDQGEVRRLDKPTVSALQSGKLIE